MSASRSPWKNPPVASSSPPLAPFAHPQTVTWTSHLASSFARRLHRPLDPALEGLPPLEYAKGLYQGPYVVLSHDADMKYNFANVCGQKLWGYDWNQYMGMDSWRSTPASEAEAMEGRRKLWAHMDEYGVMHDFRGLRVAGDGTLFTIEGVTVWTVDDDEGIFLGHAVIFDTWTYEKDGRVGGPGDFVLVD